MNYWIFFTDCEADSHSFKHKHMVTVRDTRPRLSLVKLEMLQGQFNGLCGTVKLTKSSREKRTNSQTSRQDHTMEKHFDKHPQRYYHTTHHNNSSEQHITHKPIYITHTHTLTQPLEEAQSQSKKSGPNVTAHNITSAQKKTFTGATPVRLWGNKRATCHETFIFTTEQHELSLAIPNSVLTKFIKHDKDMTYLDWQDIEEFLLSCGPVTVKHTNDNHVTEITKAISINDETPDIAHWWGLIVFKFSPRNKPRWKKTCCSRKTHRTTQTRPSERSQ